MDPVIMLHRNKQGEPERLWVRAPYALKDTVKAAGCGTARWSSRDKAWTMPPDPLIVKRLSEFIPGIVIDPSLNEYLQELMNRQEKLYKASIITEPISPNDKLWKFQRAGVRVMEAAGSIILGDEMGLGKTPTSCSAIDYIGAAKVIIVCPSQVKWAWVDHLKDWGNRENPFILESRNVSADNAQVIYRNREAQLTDLIESPEFVLIMGYEMMRKYSRLLSSADYDVLVFDEAHRIKNRKALVTQAAMRIAKSSARTWLLTGTPARNKYDDLFTLLSIIDPIRFSSYWNFVNVYMETVSNLFGGTDIVGLRNTEEFNSMISVYMLRRTKQEVLPDLPDKIYTDYKLFLNPEQEDIYKQMEDSMIVAFRQELEEGKSMESVVHAPNTVAQIIRLRQICLNPALIDGPDTSAKLDMLSDLVEEIIQENQRLVIFTCFKGFLNCIEEMLSNRGLKYGIISGDISSKNRYKVQQALTEGEIDIVAGTIQSMGEGMNLQAASTAVFCDIDWVPANNMQAEDRIHRGDIKTAPNIIRLYHPDTVESDIWATCRRKEAIVDRAIGSAETIRRLILRREGK
jgi:SNF2 family DNA or RNA helicase